MKKSGVPFMTQNGQSEPELTKERNEEINGRKK